MVDAGDRLFVDDERISDAGAMRSWDPVARILTHTYEPRARPGATQARRSQAWAQERVGSTERFGVLADVENADSAAVAWRYRSEAEARAGLIDSRTDEDGPAARRL